MAYVVMAYIQRLVQFEVSIFKWALSLWAITNYMGHNDRSHLWPTYWPIQLCSYGLYSYGTYSYVAMAYIVVANVVMTYIAIAYVVIACTIM